jgi:hypothetical protein
MARARDWAANGRARRGARARTPAKSNEGLPIICVVGRAHAPQTAARALCVWTPNEDGHTHCSRALLCQLTDDGALAGGPGRCPAGGLEHRALSLWCPVRLCQADGRGNNEALRE